MLNKIIRFKGFINFKKCFNTNNLILLSKGGFEKFNKDKKTQDSQKNNKKIKMEDRFKKMKKNKKNNNNDDNNNNDNNNIYKIVGLSIAAYIFYLYFIKTRNYYDNIGIKELEYYINNNLINHIQIKREQVSNNKYITIVYLICNLSTNKKIIIEEEELEMVLSKIEDLQKIKNKNSKSFIPVNFVHTLKNDDFRYHNIIKNFIFLGIGVFIFSFNRNVIKKIDFNSLLGKNNSKKNNFKIYKKTDIKFENVAGLKQAKKELMEFVEFLKTPEKFQKLGAKIPKGALLNGPPGNGKTYLAKAIAGEANVPFFYVSGSEFVEMYVGVGASRVRKLFKEAKKQSPSIIFIDEIDAVGGKRNSGGNGNDETESTLNQILVEMDGFEENNSVIVIAATNRKDILDKALLRPGRFDRIIDITNPEIQAREEIFEEHLKKIKTKSEVKILSKRLATLTPGFSCAEIASICNESAIIAARKELDAVDDFCFEMAVEKILAGIEKKDNLSLLEKEIIAVHECGHAITSWFLKGGSPLLKLTTIPRSKGSLGFAQYLPNESNMKLKEEILDEIKIALGGRQAELLFFNKVTTGASNDFQQAYQLAREYVLNFGFSDKIGLVSYSEDQNGNKIYGEKINSEIDLEIENIIKLCSEESMNILKLKNDYLIKLKNKLLEKKVLNYIEIKDILGERPFKPAENFKRYLNEIEEKIEITNELETKIV